MDFYAAFSRVAYRTVFNWIPKKNAGKTQDANYTRYLADGALFLIQHGPVLCSDELAGPLREDLAAAFEATRVKYGLANHVTEWEWIDGRPSSKQVSMAAWLQAPFYRPFKVYKGESKPAQLDRKIQARKLYAALKRHIHAVVALYMSTPGAGNIGLIATRERAKDADTVDPQDGEVLTAIDRQFKLAIPLEVAFALIPLLEVGGAFSFIANYH